MYEVQYQKTNEMVADSALTADRMIFLNNLQSFTSYSMSVRALNDHGAGPYGERFMATTLVGTSAALREASAATLQVVSAIEEPLAPSGPPFNLKAIGTTFGIALMWDEIREDHGNEVIIAYEVHYSNHQNTCDLIINTTVTVTHAALTNLEEGKPYEISVRARYKDGPGPYSEVAIATMQMDDVTAGHINASSAFTPSAPSNVTVISVSLTSVYLEWDQLQTQPDNNISYEVHYKALTHDDTENIVNSISTSVILTDLFEWTLYVFSVRALVPAGVGSFSHIGFVKTTEDSKGQIQTHANISKHRISNACLWLTHES
jgi:hypothetical protein